MGSGLYPVVPAIGLRLFGKERDVARLGLRQTAHEWGVSVAGVVARPLGWFGERMTSTEGPRPIIVVHGYAMNRACFRALAAKLSRAGLGPVYGFEYWSLGKVSSAARGLHSMIERICEAHGCDQVDLVGHSMGGLVGRYYLSLGLGRNRGRVANFLTLGTPHGGSVFSGFGVGRAKIELSPHTPMFQRMSAAPLPPGVCITVVWSRSDALVASARQAQWSGTEELVYDDLGHIGLLRSRRVAAEVIARLARPLQRE